MSPCLNGRPRLLYFKIYFSISVNQYAVCAWTVELRNSFRKLNNLNKTMDRGGLKIFISLTNKNYLALKFDYTSYWKVHLKRENLCSSEVTPRVHLGCQRSKKVFFFWKPRSPINISECNCNKLSSVNQDCQIFLDTINQKGGKYTKLPLNNQMAIKCTKWP
jgi:hypothetical protein